jgi:pimeloyl-ACP methyl ester carboxylesterase
VAIESTALYSVDMERFEFCRGALRLSYLDWGWNGRVLIALHAHVMEALTFAPLAAALAPEWRVVALDQRGHGYSDHASSYSRDDYISDLEAFVNHLGLTNFILLGNSLGGVNAYQFAARLGRWMLRTRRGPGCRLSASPSCGLLGTKDAVV